MVSKVGKVIIVCSIIVGLIIVGNMALLIVSPRFRVGTPFLTKNYLIRIIQSEHTANDKKLLEKKLWANKVLGDMAIKNREIDKARAYYLSAIEIGENILKKESYIKKNTVVDLAMAYSGAGNTYIQEKDFSNPKLHSYQKRAERLFLSLEKKW